MIGNTMRNSTPRRATYMLRDTPPDLQAFDHSSLYLCGSVLRTLSLSFSFSSSPTNKRSEVLLPQLFTNTYKSQNGDTYYLARAVWSR